MKPGDPFETEALDELRSEQRRTLRSVPDWLIEEYGPKGRIERPSGDAALLEVELRTIARDLEQKELAGALEEWTKGTRTEVLFEFLKRQGQDVQLKQRGRTTGYVFSNMIGSMRRDAEKVRVTSAPAQELAASLMRYLHLLVWADDLAADDYRDTRVARLPAKEHEC